MNNMETMDVENVAGNPYPNKKTQMTKLTTFIVLFLSILVMALVTKVIVLQINSTKFQHILANSNSLLDRNCPRNEENVDGQYACQGWISGQSFTSTAPDGKTVINLKGQLSMDSITGERNTRLIRNFLDKMVYTPNRTGDGVENELKSFYESCIQLKKNSSIIHPVTGRLIKWMFLRQESFLSLQNVVVKLVTLGEDDPKHNSIPCTELAKNLFPEVVGKLFVENHYLNDNLAFSVQQLLLQIRDTYLSHLDVVYSPWVDFQSWLELRRRINSAKIMQGYPTDIMDSIWVASVYANVTINKNVSHFIVNLVQLMDLREMRKQTLGMVTMNYFDNIRDVAANYLPSWDMLFISAGYAQFPIYHESFPDVLKFGRLGFIIAHEFGHALSAYIRTNDQSRGELPFGASNATYQKFIDKLNCIENEYNTYQIPFSFPQRNTTHALTWNGSLTLEENFADFIALKISFSAFMKEHKRTHGSQVNHEIPGLARFSKEQLFFIANAQ
ncbi:Endothelin-converting enzyme-like 1, partial [Folsomia candida]